MAEDEDEEDGEGSLISQLILAAISPLSSQPCNAGVNVCWVAGHRCGFRAGCWLAVVEGGGGGRGGEGGGSPGAWSGPCTAPGQEASEPELQDWKHG